MELEHVALATMPLVRCAIRDPHEGVTARGTITTGARRQAIAPEWIPVLEEVRSRVGGQASLYVYGSVANGTAVTAESDVDLLTLDLSVHDAHEISTQLSARFEDRCRAVTIAPARLTDLHRDTDESYGLQVFLRHYCVHLAGPDPAAGLPEYAADARAARGLNGDIAGHRAAWIHELQQGVDADRLGTRIARKTLLAVAGIVSVRDGDWTTDRRTAAARWNELEPDRSVETLQSWLGQPPTDARDVNHELHGSVGDVELVFSDEIGLWRA